MAEKTLAICYIRDGMFRRIYTNTTYYLTIDKKFLAVSLSFKRLIGISLIVHNGETRPY